MKSRSKKAEASVKAAGAEPVQDFAAHMDKVSPQLSVMRPITPCGARAWERQADDTDASWAAFLVYRDLRSSQGRRSLADAARALGVYPSAVKAMSTRYGWASRCAALDRHLDRERVRPLEEEAREAGRETLRILTDVIEQCRAQLEELDGLEGPQALEMRAKIVSAISEAYKTQRLVLGQATTTHAHVHKHEGTALPAAMTPDQQLAMRFALVLCGQQNACPNVVRASARDALMKLAIADLNANPPEAPKP